MRTPFDIIAWTGWTKEDYNEFLIEALITFLRYGVTAMCVVFAIVFLLMGGPSVGFFALLIAMIAIIFICIKFGADIEEARNARERFKIERPCKPSGPLYFKLGDRIDRCDQGLHGGSSGIRSSGYRECIEILNALEEQKRNTRPTESQVVYR